MKILITGDKGFIGRNFRSRLEKEGHQVTGVDIKSGEDCRDFFRKSPEKFDLVIHCAAIVGGRLMIEGNPIAVATDLSIDAEMFNWAVQTKQPRVVYFSSSAAYPVNLQTKPYNLKESDINLADIHNPDMTYGWAKLTGEYLARFAREQGVKVHLFRPFSGYGEDQDLDYPFPSFIERGRKKMDPFEIWGDGNQVRDFIHMDDIYGAVMKAVELNIEEPVNLGWGRPTSFNELAKLVAAAVGYNPQIKHLGEKPVGVQYRSSDNSKLLSFYKPVVTLEEGIRRALAYSRP